jgi:hypothetical protein
MMTEQTDVIDQDQIFQNHDDLDGASKHAATLAAHFLRPGGGFAPLPGELTGTVTFLEIRGKTYALTAAHVIDQLDTIAMQHGMPKGSFIVPKAPGYSISGPFLQVRPGLPSSRTPDVAIRPVNPKLITSLGKVAFVIRENSSPADNISHGIAVGYPTRSKEYVSDPHGKYVAMQSVHAIAKCTGHSLDQFIFRSELKEWPATASLSGMSGGPVFWSDADNYGLAGIVVEAIDSSPGESFFNFPMVQFNAHRVSVETLVEWAEYADKEWPLARERINESIRASEKRPNT